MKEIMDKLKAILSKVNPDYDISKVNEKTNLKEDLGMDSLAMMLVSMELEDAFAIHFTDPVDFKTVGDVIGYLQAKGVTA